MTNLHFLTLASTIALLLPLSCNVSILPLPSAGGGSGQSPAPDGIDPDNPNVERKSRQLDFDGVDTLRIDIPTGRVTVRRQDDLTLATLRITKTILVQGRSAGDLRELLAESEVTADRSFIDLGRLEIEATPARGLADTDIAFDLLIALPRGVPMEIIVDNGPVEVTAMDANVEIRTNNGTIVVRQVIGHVVARTSERPIEIIDTTGNIEAKTTNADISVRAAPPADGFVTVETTDGSIDLAIALETGAELRLDARQGAIAADLNGFHVTNLAVGDDLLSGTLNDGGGKIEARTINGEITFVGL